MRFLFVTVPFSGHYQPLVPLAWAARASGHDVAVASFPAFAEAITRLGLPAVPVGPDLDPMGFLRQNRGAAGSPVDSERRGFAGFRRTAEKFAEVMAPDAMEFSRFWRPDAVVYEPMSLLGPLLARVTGVPAIRQLWGLDFTGQSDAYSHGGATALAAAYGLGGLPVNGDLTIDPCPPGLQISDSLPRQLVRYVPSNGRTVFPAWLREPPGRPRICVSWGTTLGNLGLDRMRHVPELVRALGSADVEIVLAVLDEHRELFTELPRNVVAVGPVALDLVLPTCDALVHQSGAGTSMTALIHGVPQLLVPTVPEQVFNAQRLVPAGAARCVPSGEQAEQEEIRAALKSILADEECRRAAQELSRTMRAQPTPAEVVSVIEKVTADG